MLSLNIQNAVVYLRDIKPENLPDILVWYNRVNDYKYATGIDSPITIEQLRQKYAEVAICSMEFFTGVYSCLDKKMIGILKGCIGFKYKDAAWISSIVIDTGNQNRGFGSSAINLLIDFLKTNYHIKDIYIAVIENNMQGKNFWEKHSFIKVRKMKGSLKLDEMQQNIIIMHKRI